MYSGVNGNKRSRNAEEFSVDLRGSASCISGGVGTSMSINFMNNDANVNFKLYNEMSGQLEVLKLELEKCKEKIETI